MTLSPRLVSGLLCGASVLGCMRDETSGDTEVSTTKPSGNESGSETSAANGSTSVTEGNSASTSGGTSNTAAPTTTGNPPYECDPWAQDCPEGQKCAAYSSTGSSSWDGTTCVDVTGTDEPGEKCQVPGDVSGIDSCIKGAMCWGNNDDGIGTCVALCIGSPEAPVCATHSICTISGVLNLCLPSCNPLLQDCLDPALVCYAGDSTGFHCAPDASGATGQTNDPCEALNGCDEGFTCEDALIVGAGCTEGPYCCTPWCNFPDGTCPNPDQQCVEFFSSYPAPTPDYAKIGFCGVPS